MSNKYEQLKNKFLSGNIDGCLQFFEKNNYFLESAYCYLILEDKLPSSEAQKILDIFWSKIK